MSLKLRDLEFAVEEATLHGWLDASGRRPDDGVRWSLQVRCAEKAFQDESWRPVVSYGGLDWRVRSWTDLATTSHAWSDAEQLSRLKRGGRASRRSRDAAPSLSFYVFEHGGMRWGEIAIGRRDGLTFALRWKGVCDIHFDDAFRTDVPFEIQCPVRFSGITVSGRGDQSKADLTRALAAAHALEGLKPQPMQRRPVERSSRLGKALAFALPPLRHKDLLSLDFKP